MPQHLADDGTNLGRVGRFQGGRARNEDDPANAGVCRGCQHIRGRPNHGWPRHQSRYCRRPHSRDGRDSTHHGGLGLIGMWLWLINVRLLIGPGAVGYRNFFGRSRFWSRAEMDRVVSMAVSYGKSSQPLRAIYCFGIDGRRLLALNVRAWQPDDLKDFIEATGRALDVRDAPIPAKDARREFPNAFGWGAQHVMLMTSLTMLGAVLLAVAGYVLVSTLLLR